MNKSPVLALAALLLLGACNRTQAPPARAPLEGANIGGPFTLIDQNGRTVRDSDFAGKYRIVYFGYTYCPDVCPADLSAIANGLKLFEKQHPADKGKVVPIFITVDPVRDTPAVLKQYAAAFGPEIVALTGSQSQIDAVAQRFAVYHAKEPGSAPDRYLVSHSETPYLLGPQGQPIAILPVDDRGTPDVNEGSPQAVAQFLGQWVR